MSPAEGPAPAPPSQRVQRWLDVLMRTDDDPLYAVEALLLEERAQRGAWHRVAQSLDEVITAIGQHWREGRISILEERVASGRLTRAIEHLGARMPTGTALPVALLATAANDDHTLGLSLVELCMREAGWRTLWAGRATPPEEIVARVASGGLHAVAASASSHSNDGSILSRWLDLVAPACKEHGVHLLLGGRGAWPTRPIYGTRIHDFGELTRYLAATKLT